MRQSTPATKILKDIAERVTKLGEIRALAKEIKKDHELAMELWESQNYFARQLALLIMEKKLLTDAVVDRLIHDINQHQGNEKLQLIDWLMANQLTKDKKTIAMIESWEDSPISLKRRLFWYFKGRLRWTGKEQNDSGELLSRIENKIDSESPEVQWAMNFTAGWIGVFENKYRERCVKLGEKTGLYKGKMVSKGCTPEYLPEFIAIESEKRNL